ncbi:large ribosomal subunit protein eL21-like [Vicugna pacos]|uniref:Large ribosomal subunit protein eL21-like n=1 Tax=Vicugna pacos TaxID=30538 RepID=A0ABM5DMA5_VICPA
MFAGPFRKHEVVPSTADVRTYKQGDTADIREPALFKQEHPICIPKTKPRGSTECPACCWHCRQQTVKGKILAQRINIRVEHIQHKSQESFLTRVKENDQTKEEAKESGTWSELKRQPAPGRAVLWGPGERGLGRWDGSL